MRNLLIALLLVTCQTWATDDPAPVAVTIQAVAFAPNASSELGYGDCDCTQTVVEAIGNAKTKILLQAYNFTSDDIATALIVAAKRGVDVYIIGDRSVPTEKNSKAQKCYDAGISVLIDKKHKIAHNKIIIIDDEIVITGSFNWTTNAEESNAENLLVIKSDKIAALYTANFKVHMKHAEKFDK